MQRTIIHSLKTQFFRFSFFIVFVVVCNHNVFDMKINFVMDFFLLFVWWIFIRLWNMICDSVHWLLPYFTYSSYENLKHHILFVHMMNVVVVVSFLDWLIIQTGTLYISLTCTLRTIFNLIYLPQMWISMGDGGNISIMFQRTE